MTTPETNPVPATVLSVSEGPVGRALRQLAAAATGTEAAVNEARDAVQAQRGEFIAVLREAVAAHVAGHSGGPDPQVADLVRSLYWEHEDVRVSDVAAALGCTSRDVREIAGSRRVRVPCVGCGRPTEAEQSSRSRSPLAICAECAAEEARRQELEAASHRSMLPGYREPEPMYPSFAPRGFCDCGF